MQAAERDAFKLHSYFLSAGVTGPLELAVEDGNWRPTRQNLFARFARFIATIPSNTAGLIFFAGHGFSLQKGLVLAACDYIPAIGWDAGLPLRRLFELAKEQQRRNVRVIFVLDCCRNGSNRSLIDDVPANVLIVYACAHGGAGFEDKGGGLLTSAFTQALEQLSATARHDSPACGFHIFIDKLQREYLILTRDPASQVEIVGFRPDLLQIPLCSATPDFLRPGSAPKCIITGRSFPEEDIQTIRQTVHLWSALQLDTESIRQWLDRTVIWEADKRELSVAVQSVSPFATGEALLHKLVNRFRSLFESLRFEWQGEISPNIFRGTFSNRNEIAWIQTPDGDLGIRWNNLMGEHHTVGQGWIVERSNIKTVFHFECQNQNGDGLPLFYLQPTIIEIFLLLNSIKGNASIEN